MFFLSVLVKATLDKLTVYMTDHHEHRLSPRLKRLFDKFKRIFDILVFLISNCKLDLGAAGLGAAQSHLNSKLLVPFAFAV